MALSHPDHPKPELHTLEPLVAQISSGTSACRLRVDGGWLYITVVRTVGVSTTFVPDHKGY